MKGIFGHLTGIPIKESPVINQRDVILIGKGTIKHFKNALDLYPKKRVFKLGPFELWMEIKNEK